MTDNAAPPRRENDPARSGSIYRVMHRNSEVARFNNLLEAMNHRDRDNAAGDYWINKPPVIEESWIAKATDNSH